MAEVVDVLLRARGEFSDLTGKISSLRKEFQSLKLPKDITENLEKGFNRLEPILKSYQRQLDKGFKTKTDLKNFEAMRHELDAIFSDINSEIQKVNGQPVQLKADLKEITALEKKLDNFGAKLQKALDKISIDRGKQVAGDIERLVAATNKASSIKPMTIKAQDLFNQQDFAAFNSEIDKIQNKILGLSNVRGAKVDLAKAIMGPNFTSDVQAMDAAIQKFFNDLKVPDKAMNGIAEINRDITQTGTALSQVKTDSLTRGAQVLAELGGSAQKASQNAKELGDSIDGAASSSVRMAEELQQLKTSTQYFFSLRNMINLFKRGVREAVDVIKELDAAMTETAVVTEYSVGDMWKKLPEYTNNANALGATVKDMYEATTLYYQQGLDTDQAMSIATETMKMARIAGLEAADATDKMTAALRGFNMELNETSAQRINDVYSNLAAKTASDTEELGTAMQRTASIAHSAGMSFEGTAAFLAQAIETTREPAENIGTAMKTIVARFQEMKKNPLELTEVDGEEVSFNKVDQALQSIGVSLKDANGQFRALDQVFLEISQRWDSLSQTQQRYIATTAAGSRQQSRFIAMMSNYDRTIELMNYANNSAGASNEQFGKTMESLEAKLNKLKNAWNEFLMGIMNDSMTKFVVDAGTTLLGILNKITDVLSFGGRSGLLKSITSLTAAFMGLKAAGKVINWGVDKAGGLLSPSTPMFGFKGEGGKVSKTTATIVNPIVAEIRQVVAAIKSQPLKTGTNETGTIQQYKDSQTNLRNLLGLNDQKLLNGSSIDAKRTLSYSQITDNLKGLSDTQQRQLLGTLPGLQQAMRGATLNMLSNNGVSKDSQKIGQQITKDIIKGMNKGTISVEKGIDLLRNPQKWGQHFGNQFNEGNLQEISKAVTGPEFNKLVEEAQDKYAQAVYRGKNADRSWLSEEEIAAKQADFEKYAQRKLKNKAPIEEIDYNKYNQLGDKIGQVGAGFATAGHSVQQFGVVLSNLGLEKAGALLMRIGSSVSSLGMAFNGLGTILPKITERFADAGKAATDAFKAASTTAGGAAKGGGAFLTTLFGSTAGAVAAGVGVAVAAAVIIKNQLEKKAKEAGEEVRKQFDEGFTQTDDKIKSLESYEDRFNDLAKGVDQFGHNINLTTEEYDEYLNISRELQQISPSLIAGYNAEGQAIIKKGEAIQGVIDKLEQEKQLELALFTSNSSVDKLIGEYKTSDAYKTYSKTQKMGTTFDAFYGAKAKIGALNEDDLKFGLTDAINKLTGWSIESLSHLTTEQLDWVTQHYNDVIELVEEENGKLDDEVKEGYVNAFTDAGAAIQDVMSEGKPIVDALQMWMGAEGLDATGLNLGEEFAYSFNQGMQSIMLTGLTEGWDADTFKDNLRDYSKEWNRLAGENSKYNQILSEAQELQENYLNTVGQADAIDNYKQQIEASAVALEQLAEAQDTSTAAGQAFAEQCVAQANALRNYATEGVMSLGEALNSLSDEFASARNAKERFDKATEGGDYYTAAEGYKGIIDTILDDKNLAGNGSLTFWAGADELLGKDFVDSSSYDEVVKQINRVKGAFEDGSDGVIAFNNYLTDMWYELGGENGKLAGLGTVGNQGFEFNLQNEDLAEYAELLHISEDALAALIDKARQWVPISLGDPRKIRAALEVDAGSMIGESKNEAGKQTLYYSESAFRNEARQQGIRGDDYTATRDTVAEEQNVKFLTVEDLTTKGGELSFDKVADDLGLKGADKTLENSVDILSKMGFGLDDTKKILESADLANGAVTPEDIEKAYKEQEFAVENPTVAGIANDTGTIANAAMMMLAQMGILTDQAKEDIDKATSNSTLAEYETALSQANTAEEHNAAVNSAKEQIATYNAWANAIKDTRGEDDPYYTQLIGAAERLEEAVKESDNTWAEKLDASAERLESVIGNFDSIASNEEDQSFLTANSLDLENAIQSGDTSQVTTLLQQWRDEGALSFETITALTESLSNVDGMNINELNQFLGDTRDILKAIESVEFEPFTLDFNTTEEYEKYINGLDINENRKQNILLNAELTGDDKVERFINSLNAEFGDNNDITKQVLIEATAKYASGDSAGGLEALQKEFGEDKALEIEPEIKVLASGAVIDSDGLQQELKNEVANLDISDLSIENIQANIDLAFSEPKELPQEHYSSDYIINVDPDGSAQSKIDTLTQTQNKTITITPSFEGTWTKEITITKKTAPGGPTMANGSNNRIAFPGLIHIGGSSAKGRHGTIGPKDKGGLTLTGEKGFEIAWLPSENRSMILGAKGPQMLNLPNDAVVYTHEQSKRILSQKGIPAGSHDSDSTRSAGLLSGIGGGGGGSTRKKGKKGKKNKKKKKKDKTKADINNFSIEEVVQFNIDQELTRLTDQIARRTKDIEKALGKIGTTYSDIVGSTQAQLTALQGVKDQNQALYDSYARQLADYRSQQTYISYTNSKGDSKQQKINIGAYLNADGSANTAAIAAAGGREVQEAIFKVINSAKGMVDGMNNAKKAIDDANDQIDEFHKKIADTFYNWENQITWVYDLTQRLNNIQSLRDRFSEHINLELDKVSAGFSTVADALNEVTAAAKRDNRALLDQIVAQREMINARKAEMEDAYSWADEQKELSYQISKNADKGIINQAETNLEAAKAMRNYIKSFQQREDGSIAYEIDWAKFEQDKRDVKITNTTYDAIYKQLEKLNSSTTEYNNSIKDLTSSVDQFYQDIIEAQQTQVDLEADLLEGLEKQGQERIDNLKDLNSSLEEALKDLLDEVKRKLDERRRQEDNAKTERDISQKQQRLAALRADTSGGHQVEIAQLEKEIAESQQSYQRSLEDQLLDKLQEQADEAARQRERQIELLETSNKISIDNRAMVREWVENPTKYQTEIINILKKQAGYEEEGFLKQEQIERETQKRLIEAQNAANQLGVTGDTSQMRQDLVAEQEHQQQLEQEKINTDKQLVDAQTKLAQATTQQTAKQNELNNVNSSIANTQSEIDKYKHSPAYRQYQQLQAAYERYQQEYAQKQKQTSKINGLRPGMASSHIPQLSFEQFARQRGYDNSLLKSSRYNYTAQQIAQLESQLNSLQNQKTNLTNQTSQAQKAVSEAQQAVNELQAESNDWANQIVQSQQIQQDLQGQITNTMTDSLIGVRDTVDNQLNIESDVSYLNTSGKVITGTEKLTPEIRAEQDYAIAKEEQAKRNAAEEAARQAAAAAAAEAERQRQAEAARQAAVNAYNTELQRLQGKSGITLAEIEGLKALANPLGLTAATYLQALANGTPTWKQILSALKGHWNADRLASTFSSTNFINAFNDVYGRGEYKKHAGKGTPYKTGGLADYTGPAWLDGTPSKPELVLNAKDTANFIALKDILSNVMKSTSSVNNSYGGDATYEININVDKLTSDYDVDKVAERVKKIIVKDSSYRNVTQVRNLR